MNLNMVFFYLIWKLEIEIIDFILLKQGEIFFVVLLWIYDMVYNKKEYGKNINVRCGKCFQEFIGLYYVRQLGWRFVLQNFFFFAVMGQGLGAMMEGQDGFYMEVYACCGCFYQEFRIGGLVFW